MKTQLTKLFLTLTILGGLNTLAQSPVAAYPFLGNAQDISGNNYHGTLKAKKSSGTGTNVPVSVAGHSGISGSAYTFSTPASDCGYIDFGQPAKLNFDTLSFSISLWFKYTGTPFAPTMVTNVSGSSSSGFIVGLTNNSSNMRPRFYIGPKASTVKFADILADTVLVQNNWYHLVVVADRTAQRMKCYVGGIQSKIIKASGAPYGTVVSGGMELDITGLTLSAAHSGSVIAGLTGAFLSTAFTNGTLDDIYFFDRALTQSEVTDLNNDVVPASVRENEKELNVKLYPNPAQNEINIEVGEKASLVISDLQGRALIRKDITPHSNAVDISSLAQGLYMVHVSNQNGKAVHKIMKQ